MNYYTMRFILLLIVLSIFSCIATEKDRESYNLNESIDRPEQSITNEKIVNENNKRKVFGPYIKSIQKEFQLSDGQAKEYLKINSHYYKKIKKIRSNSTMDKKALRLARVGKQKEESLKKLFGDRYEEYIRYKKKQ